MPVFVWACEQARKGEVIPPSSTPLFTSPYFSFWTPAGGPSLKHNNNNKLSGECDRETCNRVPLQQRKSANTEMCNRKTTTIATATRRSSTSFVCLSCRNYQFFLFPSAQMPQSRVFPAAAATTKGAQRSADFPHCSCAN